MDIKCGLCGNTTIEVIEGFYEGDQSFFVKEVKGGELLPNYAYSGACFECVKNHPDWQKLLLAFNILDSRINHLKYGIVWSDSGEAKKQLRHVADVACDPNRDAREVDI